MAKAAGKFATKCELKSNPDRYKEVASSQSIGEIWAMTYSPTVQFDRAIGEQWFVEEEAYDHESNACSYPTGCNNYIQVEIQYSVITCICIFQ